LKYILLIPAILFYTLFTIWPIAEVVKLSLYKTNFIVSKFVGLDNYIAIFSDNNFLLSIVNSLFYALLLIPGQIIVSLFFSLYIYNMKKRWIDVSRILFYIPVLSAGIIIAQSWQWIFKFEGPVNWLIGLFGISPINYFGQGITSIPVISFIVIMTTFGSNIIIILASILSIDKSLLEAAKIDGASEGQIKWYVIIPMIKNTLILIGLLAAINAFQIFEYILQLSPQAFTFTMTYNIYSESFLYGKYGIGAAEAIVLLIITILLSLLKKKVEND
jgi:ABC-type sugar transport system permease subunit